MCKTGNSLYSVTLCVIQWYMYIFFPFLAKINNGRISWKLVQMISHQGKHNKSAVRHSPEGIILLRQKLSSVGKDEEQMALLYITGRSVNWSIHL